MEALLNPYNLQIAMLIVINALLGLSIYAPLAAGQLSLGTAGFYAIGAYTSALLALDQHWPLYATIPAGSALAGVFAFLVGWPTLRLSGIYLAIATLAFGEMVRIVILNLGVTHGALGVPGIPHMTQSIRPLLERWGWTGPLGGPGGLYADQGASLIVLAMLVVLLGLVIALLRRQERSRIGRAVAAVRLDPLAAAAMGIPVTRTKLLVFTESGLLAGLAGGLYAHLYYFISPADFGYDKAVMALVFPVLGGSEVVWGALLGAGLLTILPEALGSLAANRPLVYGSLLMAVSVFRPKGLLTRSLWDRLSGRRRRARGRGRGSAAGSPGSDGSERTPLWRARR